ncbi:hypothetical protein BON30_06895 [Cystobacter ferrugineus]|uniref:Uncharacterized protein n=1 Tax=Cystobacter ferrugineus TaxID=83449 RepID=A0A1L9BEJ1_9BACT|nr:hypothetical protein BON30_06895 [Cystobacter ferrugineus]
MLPRQEQVRRGRDVAGAAGHDEAANGLAIHLAQHRLQRAASHLQHFPLEDGHALTEPDLAPQHLVRVQRQVAALHADAADDALERGDVPVHLLAERFVEILLEIGVLRERRTQAEERGMEIADGRVVFHGSFVSGSRRSFEAKSLSTPWR